MARPPSLKGTPRKILVIQTAFLGDIVLATSFLANLRRLSPEAEIHFLTIPVGAALLAGNELGVRVIPYDKRGGEQGFGGFVRMARRLRELSPDLVFCLHRSLRSSLLAKLSGGEVFGFREGVGSVLFAHRLPRPADRYEAEKNHALLESWAGERAKALPLFPVLSLGEKDKAEAETLLGDLDSFVILAPGSVWATKRWPAERFARLAELLWQKKGLRVVLVGGKDEGDLEAARTILAQAKSIPAPLNLVGKTSIGSLKAVIARAKFFVGNDSAPLHIAIAFGLPVLGIFGPTTKSLGFFPFSPPGKSGAVEHPSLPCRPCGLHGHNICPLGHFRCMLEIAPEAVYREAESFL